MKYTQAEFKKKKELAEAILKAKGQTMQDKLYGIYDEIILDNYAYLQKILEKESRGN